jgi:hypothetical protein
MGENEMGRHSPNVDKTAMANHKHPTSRMTSVGWYAF